MSCIRIVRFVKMRQLLYFLHVNEMKTFEFSIHTDVILNPRLSHIAGEAPPFQRPKCPKESHAEIEQQTAILKTLKN